MAFLGVEEDFLVLDDFFSSFDDDDDFVILSPFFFSGDKGGGDAFSSFFFFVADSASDLEWMLPDFWALLVAPSRFSSSLNFVCFSALLFI